MVREVEILEIFKNNERMLKICNNIEDIEIYYIVKLAYDLKLIYPHIEKISKTKTLEDAKRLLKYYIIANQLNYYMIINNCKDSKIIKQIIALDMNEQNLNIAKIISTAKDQFEAYNIRRAYTEYYIDIPADFYEGKKLPTPTKEIWYVSPDNHKKYEKMLK